MALNRPLDNFSLKISYICLSSRVKFDWRSWNEWPIAESFCEKKINIDLVKI